MCSRGKIFQGCDSPIPTLWIRLLVGIGTFLYLDVKCIESKLSYRLGTRVRTNLAGSIDILRDKRCVSDPGDIQSPVQIPVQSAQ